MFDFSQTFQDEIHQPFTLVGDSTICAVLIHGFPGTPSEMRPIAEILHSHGWTVHVPLLPGFGIEINTLPEKTYSEWLSAVLNAIQTYRSQYNKLLLIGFSMGGALSIQASILTDLDGLLLLAPFWKIEHILWSTLPAIRIFVPNFKPFALFKPNFDDPDFRKTIHEWMPTADIDDPNFREQILQFAIPTNMINQIRIAGNQARQAITQVNIPTTVIQGRSDELVKPQLTQTLVQYMRADVSYILVDGDHNLTDINKPQWGKVKAHIHKYAVQFEHDNNR